MYPRVSILLSKDGFTYGRDGINKDPDFKFMCIHVNVIHNMFFICAIYYPQDDRITKFNQIAVYPI